MESQRLPPKILGLSFLLVVGSFLVVFSALIVWLSLLAWLFFPQTVELLSSKPLSVEEFAAQVETAMPTALFCSAAVFNLGVCYLTGYFLARYSRFAPQGHGVFAAMLVCVSFLQTALGVPQEMKWMPLSLMLVFPCVMLWGTSVGLRRRGKDATE